jgi:hypothetical protein
VTVTQRRDVEMVVVALCVGEIGIPQARSTTARQLKPVAKRMAAVLSNVAESEREESDWIAKRAREGGQRYL